MAKLEYRLSPKTIQDLRKIWLYVSARNEPAADALLNRIEMKIIGAVDQPFIGAARSSYGPKARILIEGQYVIVYEPADYGVYVVTVVHGRQSPPDWFEDERL